MACKANAFIHNSEGVRISCHESIKALGICFANKPTMEAHVQGGSESVRYWTIDLQPEKTVVSLQMSCYSLSTKTVIRPVMDYDREVSTTHSSLTDNQDKRLERLQSHALKRIFGPGIFSKKIEGKG